MTKYKYIYMYMYNWASQVAQGVKNSPAMKESAGDSVSIPVSRRSLGKGNDNLLSGVLA